MKTLFCKNSFRCKMQVLRILGFIGIATKVIQEGFQLRSLNMLSLVNFQKKLNVFKVVLCQMC